MRLLGTLLKDLKSLKKSDGKKQNRLKGIPKLEDANWAGSKNSDKSLVLPIFKLKKQCFS